MRKVVSFCFLALLAVPIYGQSTSATITGTIRDILHRLFIGFHWTGSP